MKRRCIMFGVLAAAVLGGCGHKTDVPPAEIAVSNSYLHAVVRDLCGSETVIFSLVPPGMCPGHFDIKPADVRRLHQCRLLLAFDFQQSIRDILPENGRGPAFHAVTAPPGMCIPDVYLAMVRQTADLLIAEYPQRRPHFSRRLDAIADRIASLNAECRAAAESLKLSDAPVLTSRHQSVFAEWLGLNVIATFSGRDTETAANINDAIRRSDPHTLRCIIANQQEGTQLARALADWFDAPVAVFSNFPAAAADDAHTPAFDDLVRDNLRRLAEAAQ